MSRLKVFGHRGAPRRAVENTIEAFDAAEAIGVDGIELDVRVTACGELVLHYAPDFHVGGRQYMISTLALREIREMEAEREGLTYRIPTLRELFERYEHDLDYFVELKPCNVPTPGIYEESVVRLVRHFGLESHVLVVSFSAELLRRVGEIAPTVATSLVFEHPAAIAALGQEGGNFPPVHALHPKLSIVDDALLEQVRPSGLPLHVWIVNEVEDLERAKEVGALSVTTDAPGPILEALGRPLEPLQLPSPRYGDDGLRRWSGT